MKKIFILSLVTLMTFSFFGCSADATSTIEPTSPSISGNEEETTTKATPTEEATTEEPTTEVFLDDGKMSEYVAAAQKTFEAYKVEYEATYDEVHPYTAFAFRDFNMDTIPELCIMIVDVYGNLNGDVYLYKNGEYSLSKYLWGYKSITSYSNSDGNTLLLCRSYAYTDYDQISAYTFSADVDYNFYMYYDLDIGDPDYYIGQSFTPRSSKQNDPSHYYNSADELITEEEFNNNLNEAVKSYVKNELKYSEPEFITSGIDQALPLSRAYSNYIMSITK